MGGERSLCACVSKVGNICHTNVYKEGTTEGIEQRQAGNFQIGGVGSTSPAWQAAKTRQPELSRAGARAPLLQSGAADIILAPRINPHP